jgi:NAD(P)-dependent dehydrogenase (short-subunit alcohol dehydrogenase family)
VKIDKDMFRLDGKVAVITGGSRGIGKAIALGMATFGADVGIAGLSPESQDTVREIEALGQKGAFVKTDVGRVREVQEAMNRIAGSLGTVDILVNNAGVAAVTPAEEVSEEEWDSVAGVNLKGLFFASQAAARIMKDHGRGGRIINIGSIFGLVGSELGASVYHASKGAVQNLTRALACEWAKYGILVNNIGPGFIVTDMTQALRENPVMAKALEDRHALKRFGRTEEIVGAAVFLASPAASFVTGENLYVDGGYTAW